MPDASSSRKSLLVHRDHRRTFQDNLYVYAVVSRRSKGLSIGVNLNPDKICNFDCVYCQVDRRTPPATRDVDFDRLAQELEDMIRSVTLGDLFEHERFRLTPHELRRLNDIAFSGDGEPTTCGQFREVVETAGRLRRAHDLDDVKLVLITNATRFHVPQVRQALGLLDANNGEIWAKLDAGTEAYYHTIERTTIPFRRVLDNITEAARLRPIVIQAMFLRLQGEPPDEHERLEFCKRLEEVLQVGGRIKLVQVYTVARVPAEPSVTPLENAEVDAIGALVRSRTGLPVETYYGP
jgi:wyosine [tRNA(Phe)-imidazoG37] synthetase (radical SAM superfamily)